MDSSLTLSYKIHLEKGNDFLNSIFSEVYNTAKDGIIDIIVNTNTDNAHKFYNDDYNNVIAFTGERGRGKSSTMISFLEALVNKSDSDHKCYFNNEENIPINDCNFETIDVIDPTLFREREKETLFEIIVAKMFHAFRNSIEKDSSNHLIKDDDRRTLIKCFQKVFEDLKYLKNRDSIYKEDALDALIKLSTSSNLKNSFEKLIDDYLLVMGERSKKNFLVIAIDDFDLKIDGVYEMLEDVRRFLISRKIILLISCRMEQMREALEIHLSINKFNNNTISNQVEKYIEKLIPVSRIIEMPSPQEINWNIKEITNFFDDNNSIPHQYKYNFNKSVLRKLYENLDLFFKDDAHSSN